MDSHESDSHMSVDASAVSYMSISNLSQTTRIVSMSISSSSHKATMVPMSISGSHSAYSESKKDDLDLDDDESEWAEALNGTSVNNQDPVEGKHGKWLIYGSKNRIQKVWKKIKKATEAGHLGYLSSRSCAESNAKYGDPDRYLICVFTYNVDDVLDVMRVRILLVMLGIRETIGYKTSLASLEGRYNYCGHQNVCVFRISAEDLESTFSEMGKY